jgi:hypothetical protein
MVYVTRFLDPCVVPSGYATLDAVSTAKQQVAQHPVIAGAGAVAGGAGVGAVFALGARALSKPERRQFDFGPGVDALGGALTGVAATGVGGLLVAAVSPRYRGPALAASGIAIGGVALLFAAGMAAKKMGYRTSPPVIPAAPATPGTPPSTSTTWTEIPTTTALQPGSVYRVSDTAAASDATSPPTVASMQSYLGPLGVTVSGVWYDIAPGDWPAEPAGAARDYMQFTVTKTGVVLPGLTSGAILYVQESTT